MNDQSGSHPLDDTERQTALRRQSDDYLRDARHSGSADCQAQCFFQAGYLALLSSLASDEVKRFQSHPSATAVAFAGDRIQLALNDLALAEHGARTYYSADPLGFGSVDVWSAWATRARHVVGWDSGPLTA